MQPSGSYHIYNHANGSENIFREEENYRFFLGQYAKYLGDVLDTYAYCLMPNHFHFLVGVKSEEALIKTFPKFETLEKLVSKKFSNFFSSYTQSFNKVYDRKGSLFIKNFKRRPIESEVQWQETFLYIHLNPIKHRFTDSIEDWKWSSWQAYNSPEHASLVDRSYYMNFFGGISHVRDTISVKRELILSKDFE